MEKKKGNLSTRSSKNERECSLKEPREELFRESDRPNSSKEPMTGNKSQDPTEALAERCLIKAISWPTDPDLELCTYEDEDSLFEDFGNYLSILPPNCLSDSDSLGFDIYEAYVDSLTDNQQGASDYPKPFLKMTRKQWRSCFELVKAATSASKGKLKRQASWKEGAANNSSNKFFASIEQKAIHNFIADQGSWNRKQLLYKIDSASVESEDTVKREEEESQKKVDDNEHYIKHNETDPLLKHPASETFLINQENQEKDNLLKNLKDETRIKYGSAVTKEFDDVEHGDSVGSSSAASVGSSTDSETYQRLLWIIRAETPRRRPFMSKGFFSPSHKSLSKGFRSVMMCAALAVGSHKEPLDSDAVPYRGNLCSSQVNNRYGSAICETDKDRPQLLKSVSAMSFFDSLSYSLYSSTDSLLGRKEADDDDASSSDEKLKFEIALRKAKEHFLKQDSDSCLIVPPDYRIQE